jgi:hypothetical protein
MNPSLRSPYRSRNQNLHTSQANLPKVAKAFRFFVWTNAKCSRSVVQRSNHPALFRILNPVCGEIRDGFALLRLGASLANGLGHRMAMLGVGGEFVPGLVRPTAPRWPALTDLREHRPGDSAPRPGLRGCRASNGIQKQEVNDYIESDPVKRNMSYGKTNPSAAIIRSHRSVKLRASSASGPSPRRSTQDDRSREAKNANMAYQLKLLPRGLWAVRCAPARKDLERNPGGSADLRSGRQI